MTRVIFYHSLHPGLITFVCRSRIAMEDDGDLTQKEHARFSSSFRKILYILVVSAFFNVTAIAASLIIVISALRNSRDT